MRSKVLSVDFFNYFFKLEYALKKLNNIKDDEVYYDFNVVEFVNLMERGYDERYCDYVSIVRGTVSFFIKANGDPVNVL